MLQKTGKMMMQTASFAKDGEIFLQKRNNSFFAGSDIPGKNHTIPATQIHTLLSVAQA